METNNKLSENDEQKMFDIWEQESKDDVQIPTRKEINEEYRKKSLKSVTSSPEEYEKIQKQMTYDFLDSQNPYREMSNLHLGDMRKSFRWIETDVLLQLIKTKLSSSEWSVFFYIFHLTRGHCYKNKYYRTIYDFPIDEIQEMTGLSKSTVTRSIDKLKKKQILYEVKERGIKKLGINFRYDTWVSGDN